MGALCYLSCVFSVLLYIVFIQNQIPNSVINGEQVASLNSEMFEWEKFVIKLEVIRLVLFYHNYGK